MRPDRLRGARKGALPAKPRPQLATLVAEPPAGARWIHEIKLDGYRTLARIENGRARLLTRNGHDWTERYAVLAEALGGLGCATAVLDGEVCVQRNDGATSFAALQDALAAGAQEKLIYFVFDLPYLDGFDLGRTPLIERKRALAALVDPKVGETSPVQFSDHFEGDGGAFFAEAARRSLEGVVSKKADAAYTPGRSKTWVKAKCVHSGTFAIVGYAESAAAGGLSALMLAEREGNELRYVGKVGTGFSGAEAKSLRETLSALRVDQAPVAPAPKIANAAWVRPDLAAEIQYRARTGSGALRAAAYQGMAPVEAAPPAAPESRYVRDADLADVWVTNPDRPMFGAGGPRKLDLVLYYAEVGERMMPELMNRPLTLVRCPTGDAAECPRSTSAITSTAPALPPSSAPPAARGFTLWCRRRLDCARRRTPPTAPSRLRFSPGAPSSTRGRHESLSCSTSSNRSRATVGFRIWWRRKRWRGCAPRTWRSPILSRAPPRSGPARTSRKSSSRARPRARW